MKKHFPALTLLFVVWLLSACTAVRYQGPQAAYPSTQTMRILLIPFDNATNSEAAAVALTEMTASALSRQGANYTRSREVSPPHGDEASPRPTWFEYAAGQGYTHLLRGTVTEYHYKTDLDGDPAVGLSMRLEQVSSGKTVWQASTSATGYGFASLSSAAQRAADKLVRKLLIGDTQK